VKRYKWPGTDQILAKMIPAGFDKLCFDTHTLTNSIWNKEELPQKWTKSNVVPIHKKGNEETIITIEEYHCY
jgi:hypothetical protein